MLCVLSCGRSVEISELIMDSPPPPTPCALSLTDKQYRHADALQPQAHRVVHGVQASTTQLGTGLTSISTDDGASMVAAIPDTGPVQVHTCVTCCLFGSLCCGRICADVSFQILCTGESCKAVVQLEAVKLWYLRIPTVGTCSSFSPLLNVG